MPAVNTVLVIGGGIAGMSAAIQLRKLGVQVDLIEVDKHWRVYGAGITLSGPTLRAFASVGIIDAIGRLGALTDGLDVYTAAGQKIGELPTPRIAGPDIAGGGGILRPTLAAILRDATLASGTAVRCGTTFDAITQAEDRVTVRTTDGRSATYDLVIGADGLMSSVRRAVFKEAPSPSYTGQGCWRALAARPPSVQRAAMFMGSKLKVGVNPISKDELYLFVTEPRDSSDTGDEAQWTETLRSLLREYGGLIGEIRDGLSADSRVHNRPFWKLLMPAPWFLGRVLLIGDAVHATTPHLASGAGIGVEDAVVIADEIAKAATIDAALNAFMKRRFERCRMVVENSVRLGDLERDGGSNEEHQALMRESMAALLAPI